VTTTGRRPSSTTTAPLVARTVALAELPDLLAVAGDDGLMWREEDGGLAAHGTALRLDLPGGLADERSLTHVRQTLAGIAVEDEVGLPGCGPVAIGALPFDPAAPGTLVIPRRIVGVRAGRAWVTTVSPVEGDSAPPEPHAAPQTAGTAPIPDPPDEFTLTPSMPHRVWKEQVADALKRIEAGELDKVVLARRVDIAANRPFVKSDVLARLIALYPSCMVFSVAGFIGASPELLVARTGDRVVSHPLAGTVARSGDAHADQALVAGLMASPKARREHGYVIEVLQAALEDICVELDVPDRPSVMSLRNVSHLATRITARLDPRTPLSALELAARIHPSPAVGGNPTSVAVPYLQSVEGFDRGRYAGPVGWVDARGDGAWAIGIRSAVVDGAYASIFAGNGMVKGSDPADELTETQLKLQALLAALVRP
jgi:menaquinone-specific isochorismate synthase